MATIGDSTDPKGTKRPNKDSILVSTHTFRPIAVAERLYKAYLPSNIRPNNIYSIFSLFFTIDVLETITKNINKYTYWRYIELHLKAPWKNISVAELRAYLGVLIYRFLYSQPRCEGYWSVNVNKLIYEALASSISYTYFTQLEAGLHLSDLDEEGNDFSKIKNMSDTAATYRLISL